MTTPGAVTARPDDRAARWLLMAGAVLCAAGALAVVMAAGLPVRGASSAVEIGGLSFAPEPGYFAPPFSAAASTGGTISLASLQGKPVILNFWATWCGPCAAEMPELQRFYERYGDQVAVVGLNTGESADVIHVWAQQRGLTFPLALDEAQTVAALYQLRGQPTTFLIDPEGRIMDIIYGPADFDGLTRALTRFVAP